MTPTTVVLVIRAIAYFSNEPDGVEADAGSRPLNLLTSRHRHRAIRSTSVATALAALDGPPGRSPEV